MQELITDGRQSVRDGSGYFDYGAITLEERFRNCDVRLLKLKVEVETVLNELRLRPRGEANMIKYVARKH